MASFVDTHGTEWRLRLTIGMLPQLRAAGWEFDAGARLFDLQPLSSLDVLGRVLWVLCEEPARAAGLDPEQFARRLDGPALWAAAEAVLQAAADFFHPPATATATRERVRGVMAEWDRRVSDLLTGQAGPNAGTSSGRAGGSPGSPGSTPGPSPSARSSGPPRPKNKPSGSGPRRK